MSPREDQEFAEIAAQAAWVRRLALALSRDEQRGDDISQDALLAALDRRPHSIEDLRAWLRGVVHNLARLGHRAEAHRVEREARAARSEVIEDPALAHERLEIQANLLNAVQHLDEPYRTTVLLRWFEELEPREIAARTAVPVRTVHIRIHRALRLLREELDRRSHGDRSKWMSAWIPLLSKPALPSPELIVMNVKAKLAVTALVLVCGVTVLVVLMPREGSDVNQVSVLALPKQATATPSSAPARADEQRTDEAERVAAVEARTAATPRMAVPKLRKISGLVIDTAGARLRDIPVIFQPISMPQRFPAVIYHSSDPNYPNFPASNSDATGRFELEISSEKGVLVTEDSSWLVTYEPNIQLPDPVEGYVLVLARPNAFRGEVVDSNLRPSANAEVFFVPLGSSSSESAVAWIDPLRASLGLPMDASRLRQWKAKTDEVGQFRMDAPALIEGMMFTARAPGYASAASVPSSMGGSMKIMLHALGERQAGRVYGRVVGPRGEAIRDARIWLGSVLTRSDERGEFTLRFDDKSWGMRMIVIAEGWKPVIQNCLAESPSDAGAWPSPLVLTLSELMLSIQGVVVDAQRKPVPNSEVRALEPATWNQILVSVGEKPWERHGGDDAAMSGGVKTDEKGRFELGGLLPHTYSLIASTRDILAMTISEPIEAGTKDASIVLSTRDHRCAIAGQVLDLRGKPIVGAMVRARRKIAWAGRTVSSESIETEPVRTDEAGHFAFGELACDLTELAVQPEAAAPGTTCPILPGQELSSLVLSIPRIGHVRVRIDRSDLVADSVSFFDARGVRIQVGARRGGSAWISGASLPVTNGSTEAMVVSELASTVVLLKDGNEVARVPVQIMPGEMVVVRP